MDSNREYWKLSARSYDRNIVKERSELYSRIVELMRRDLSGDMDVLELCSGSGNLARVFSSSVHSWTGIDYSDEMVEESASLELPNASFSAGDAQDISFPDSAFDVVVIINALQVMPFPGKCLEESSRVLKKGGKLLISTYVGREHISKHTTSIHENDGFMSYHKWESAQFMSLVENFGFKMVSSCVLINEPEDVCYVSALKTR